MSAMGARGRACVRGREDGAPREWTIRPYPTDGLWPIAKVLARLKRFKPLSPIHVPGSSQKRRLDR
jgi:hypothetical protein